MIEKGQSEELTAGVPIGGNSSLYTVTPPSDGWLKNGWGGQPTENKDLGILSETGTASLDFTLRPITNKTVEEMAQAGIQWAISMDKTSNGTLKSIPIDIANIDAKGHIKRYCWKRDSGLNSCAYSYYIPYEDTFIEIHGSAMEIENQVTELEEMILSVELVGGK